MKLSQLGFTLHELFMVIAFCVWITVVGCIIYTVVHFITKFW